MAENTKPHTITIDLNQFKLHIELKNRIELTVHFNSSSRRFYLSVIAFIVNEMKRLEKITFIPLEGHHDLLALLNETIGGAAGSSEEENLLPRIYRKWKHALPNLEEAPLFMVLGKKKRYEEGISKTYHFAEAEKDSWANLFEYKGSHENVRLRFAIDKIGATLNDIGIIYEDSLDADAWERFLSSLKEKKAEPIEPIGVVASKEKMAFPLPDLPSIAVLPFESLSGDPKQEFFSDGITETIITALSKVPRLFVISRHSTFSYKGKPVKVKQVSEELGVQYVLEGSVQSSPDRIRINAQLIDALTGRHIWAERYERDLKDLFAVQDEITMSILGAIQVKLTEGEQITAHSKYFRGKQGLDCYLKIMEATQYSDRITLEDNNVARRLLEEAISMCPENPVVYIQLGLICMTDFYLDTTKPPQETLEKGYELAKKALAIDDSLPLAHVLLSATYIYYKREYDNAIAEAERAVALNPSGSFAYFQYASSLVSACRPEEAIPLFQKAIRLNPNAQAITFVRMGHSFCDSGRFEEAIPAYKKGIQRAPDYIFGHLGLVTTYSLMGREKEARAEAEEVLRINPKFSVDHFAKTALRFYKEQWQVDKIVNAWHKAGLK
jgi:TolB-like protein